MKLKSMRLKLLMTISKHFEAAEKQARDRGAWNIHNANPTRRTASISTSGTVTV